MVAGGADAHVETGNRFTSGRSSPTRRHHTLTAVMFIVVTTVSFLVHVYSIGYMSEDPSRPRFFAYLFSHLRHADAGDGGQPRAVVFRLGRRRPDVLPAGRLLVREPAPNAAAIKRSSSTGSATSAFHSASSLPII